MKHLDPVKFVLGEPGADPGAGSRPGSVPEQDSMAVISVIAALEEHCGIAVDDDISARRLATVGSVTEFVQEMLQP